LIISFSKESPIRPCSLRRLWVSFEHLIVPDIGYRKQSKHIRKDNKIVTGFMPDKREKVIETLAVNGELSMVKLVEKSEVRRNDVFDLVKELRSEKLVTIRTIGRETLVRLNSPIKKTNHFITNYPNRLKYFEKSLEKEFKALEKNLPIVSSTLPLKKVKIKRGVLELDKERNVWRDMGKTEDDYAYTFKTRPSAEKQLVKILDLLYKLYQESSSLNFAESVIGDPKLINAFQKNSEKIIKEITDKISKMLLKKDPTSFVYVNYRLRNVLYGLVYKATLEAELKKA